MITIRIETGNAAFGDTPHEVRAEVARILARLAEKFRDNAQSAVLLDYNGNTVGKVTATGRDKELL